MMDKDEVQTASMNENPVLNSIVELLQKQTDKGVAKYGHMVEFETLPAKAWINHAQEEIIDLLVYLECLKQKL